MTGWDIFITCMMLMLPAQMIYEAFKHEGIKEIVQTILVFIMILVLSSGMYTKLRKTQTQKVIITEQIVIVDKYNAIKKIINNE